jgi:hypothetical protein
MVYTAAWYKQLLKLRSVICEDEEWRASDFSLYLTKGVKHTR